MKVLKEKYKPVANPIWRSVIASKDILHKNTIGRGDSISLWFEG